MATRASIEADIPVRGKGQSTCPNHHGDTVTLVCQTCAVLACIKCISTVHRGHVMDGLDDVIGLKQLILKGYVSQATDDERVQLRNEIIKTTENIKIDAKSFEDIDNGIAQDGEHLKQQIDTIITEQSRCCKEIGDNNVTARKTFLEDIQCRHAELEKNINECKTVLQTGSNVLVYDTDMQSYAVCTKLTNPALTEIMFIPAANTADVIDKALTGICFSKSIARSGTEDSKPASLNVTSKEEKSVQSTKHEKHSSAAIVVTTDISSMQPSNTTIQGEFYAPDNTLRIYDIAVAPDNTAWVCCVNSKIVTRFDKDGTLLEEVDFEGQVHSLSVSPATGNLWAFAPTGGKYCVYEIGLSKSPSLRFSVEMTMKCICVLLDERIVAGHVNKTICVYTAGGKMITSTTIQDIPRNISECPQTRNIVVVISTMVETHVFHGRILIMDSSLHLLRLVNLDSLERKIIPVAVSCNAMGDIFVATLGSIQCVYNIIFRLFESGNVGRVLINEEARDAVLLPKVGVGKDGILWIITQNDPRTPQQIRLLKI